MLLSEFQAAALAWTCGGAVIAAGLIAAVVMFRSGRLIAGYLCVAAALAGFVLATSNFANGTRVLVMRGDAASFVRSDLRLYGSSTYPYADGHTEHLHWRGARHIIVNDTPRPLMLKGVAYGAGGVPVTKEIAPFQRAEIDGIVRHFGPADAPPSRIDTGEWVRYWLYW